MWARTFRHCQLSLLSKQILRNREVCASAFSTQVVAGSTETGGSPVCSWNEWDPLEEVIVGRIDKAHVPPATHDWQASVTPEQQKFFAAYQGKAFPQEAMDKAQAQVEEFCNILRHEGVTVRRPEVVDHAAPYSTPDWQSEGLHCAMPRDVLLVVGDDIIESPMAQRARFFEYRAYRKLIKEYFHQGATWTTAPKPTMTDELYNKDDPNNKYMTTEFEPCFDAADFARAGRDIFAQRSMMTNESGIEWMRRYLAPRGIRVHTVTFDEKLPVHIDTSLVMVGPGVAIINPKRHFYQRDMFIKAGWKLVMSPKPICPDSWPIWLGSPGLAMNCLMLDPQRVLVEKEEVTIQKMFADLGIQSIPVPFRHAFPFGGGLHCWTSDVRRRGTLETYFDTCHF